jgi:hypothetical protein
MSIFAYKADVAKPAADTLGGYEVAPTDVYDVAIELCYITKTKKGGTALNLVCKDQAGKEHNQVLYVSAINDAGEETITSVGKDGKVSYRSGFLHADAICLLAAGKPMSEVAQEDFVVKIKDWDTKKDVATQVKALKELHGKRIKLAMQRVVKNKQVLQGTSYVDTAESRTTSELVKSFRHSDNKTVVEITENQPAEFMNSWLEKYKGQDRNLFKAPTGNAGLPTTSVPPLQF